MRFDEDDDDILGLNDDDDDEGIDPGGVSPAYARSGPRAPESEADRENRLDRKRSRGKLFDTLQITQQENSQLRERLARVETTQEHLTRGQQQNQPDPYRVGLSTFLQQDRALRDRGNELIEQAAKEGKRADPAVMKQIDDALVMNDVARQEYIAENAARRTAAQAVNPDRIAAELIQRRYSDVNESPQAMKWAKGRYEMARAEGHKDSEETLERVMTAARQKMERGDFGDAPVRSRRGATEGDRRRSMGVRGGSGSAISIDEPRGRTGKMTRDEERIAEAMYPKMTQAQAHKTWIKEIGSTRDTD